MFQALIDLAADKENLYISDSSMSPSTLDNNNSIDKSPAYYRWADTPWHDLSIQFATLSFPMVLCPCVASPGGQLSVFSLTFLSFPMFIIKSASIFTIKTNTV